MWYLKEMLLRSGLIGQGQNGESFYVEGSILSNNLVVRNSSGWVTHRVERAANGVDLVVRNTSTNLVEMRFNASAIAA